MKSIYLILLIILSFTNLSYSQAVSKTKPVWEKYRDDKSPKAKDTVYQKGFRCITICNTDFQAIYDFYIRTKDQNTQVSYWCPDEDYYQNPAIKEVRQVRSILQLLERHLNLEDEFKLFKDELPNGRYEYAGIIFLKR